MQICYFIHDVGHPDLARRFGMLRAGGAETIIMGFHRLQRPDEELAHAVVDLGATVDGRFLQRIQAIAGAIPKLRRWAKQIASSQVILARNLEMLLLGAVARRLYAPHAALVYECLDIHRLMLTNHVGSVALRQLERRLLGRCQGLMVSSPAFIREYFQKNNSKLPKSFLVENKVFDPTGQRQNTPQSVSAGPPWRIGWFGGLRCRRSLDILTHTLRTLPGEVEVVAAGTPARGVFGDDGRLFAGIAGLTFLGPYADEAALAHLFRSVHFAWAADFYEAGLNSNWLLPNRLYRAALYGAVPIAMSNSETGSWLQAHQAGVLLEEPAEKALFDAIHTITPTKYASMKAAVDGIPRSAIVAGADDCRTLVRELGELAA
jgi:succinoglycan biosynthesis protein ExoL